MGAGGEKTPPPPGLYTMRSALRFSAPLFALAGGALCAAMMGGCGSSAPGGIATVRGRVTFQGQPLAGGLIVFAPDPDRGAPGRPARGEIGPDGAFQLQLSGSPAIPPGWYRVAIAPAPTSGPRAPDGAPEFPLPLSRPDHSGLVREVTTGKDQVFDFAIEVSQ